MRLFYAPQYLLNLFRFLVCAVEVAGIYQMSLILTVHLHEIDPSDRLADNGALVAMVPSSLWVRNPNLFLF